MNTFTFATTSRNQSNINNCFTNTLSTGNLNISSKGNSHTLGDNLNLNSNVNVTGNLNCNTLNCQALSLPASQSIQLNGQLATGQMYVSNLTSNGTATVFGVDNGVNYAVNWNSNILSQSNVAASVAFFNLLMNKQISTVSPLNFAGNLFVKNADGSYTVLFDQFANLNAYNYIVLTNGNITPSNNNIYILMPTFFNSTGPFSTNGSLNSILYTIVNGSSFDLFIYFYANTLIGCGDSNGTLIKLNPNGGTLQLIPVSNAFYVFSADSSENFFNASGNPNLTVIV